MPFLSAKHLIHREEISGFFVIQVQVDRKSTTYLTGIIIPCILMVAMTLLTFIAKDNYTKLGTSFTTLLMMAVYADQVKNSTPTHVQYLTWIDTFILNNLIINVSATVNSCLLILFEEREWDDLHNALGMATCYTSIPFVFIINISLLMIGYTEGGKEKTDVKETVLLLIGLSLNLMSIVALVICFLYLKMYYRNHPTKKHDEEVRETSTAIDANLTLFQRQQPTTAVGFNLMPPTLQMTHETIPTKKNDEEVRKTSTAIDVNLILFQRQQPTTAVGFSLMPPTLQMTHETIQGGHYYSANSGRAPVYYDNTPFQFVLPGGEASTGSTPHTHVI